MALFKTALQSQVGNGANTFFWTDKWFLGCSLVELAPMVVAAVPLSAQKTRTVAEALQNHNWTDDVRGGLSMIGLFEYFQLWDMMQGFIPSDE